MHEAAGIRVVFAGMHASLPPLDDVRVRQALLHAVDRKAILDNIMEGSARAPRAACWRPACSATRTCSSTSSIPFDRAKAKALLAQAGWTPGPGRHPRRRAGSGSRCRGWPRAAAIRRTARSPRPSRPCSRRSGSRPRCSSWSGPTVFTAVARQPVQPPHVHARLGDVERRRRLLAVRALPLQAGAARPAGTRRATPTRGSTRWSSRRAGA